MEHEGRNNSEVEIIWAGKRIRRGGGPRTEEGKAVSSRNAVKFGIFSKDIVVGGDKSVPGETFENYQELLARYVDSFRPQGIGEMHQVELAVIALWRYRRLLHAELIHIADAQVEHAFAYCGFENLPRYEAHLLRIYYRALNELERLQRMRLGDRVPPPVVVDVQT